MLDDELKQVENAVKTKLIIRIKTQPKDLIKNKIRELFNLNVKGKAPQFENKVHDCQEGNWLETQFGIPPNNKNKPDIFGYELKKDSKTITFGDWSADFYIISNRDEMIRTFGTSKNGRYSWSGACFPKYNVWNRCGQKMEIDGEDIIIRYDRTFDERMEKYSKEHAIIARWNKDSLKQKLENKFNQQGFFICKKSNGVYTDIEFGTTITYDRFLNSVRKLEIFLDSGMKEGNKRPYSNWRARKSYWSTLLE